MSSFVTLNCQKMSEDWHWQTSLFESNIGHGICLCRDGIFPIGGSEKKRRQRRGSGVAQRIVGDGPIGVSCRKKALNVGPLQASNCAAGLLRELELENIGLCYS